MALNALVFDPRPGRMLVPALAGRLGLDPRLPASTPLRLAAIPEPRPPAGWALLRPVAAGICGSDVIQAFVRVAWDNPLSAVTSFPHVPGHEVVAQVLDPGVPAAGAPDPVTLTAGTLVAVDPWLGCAVRGATQPCPGCAAGHPPLCSHHGEPAPAGHGAGMHLGHIAGLPGGFSPLMTAHRLRLHPLPAVLLADPGAAVLADPLAVALHTVDRLDLAASAEGPLLVLGAGTIGLCVTAALRRRHPEREVLVTAAWPHLAEAVRGLGATPLPVASEAVVEAVAARAPGAVLMRPWRGGPWLAGAGAAAVVDAVGSPGTLETALRTVRPRGRVVTVGMSRPGRAETTLGYAKEVEVRGSNGYGTDAAGVPHLAVALELLGSGAVPHRRWRTGTRPLTRWREAFLLAARPGPARSVKVTLSPLEDAPP